MKIQNNVKSIVRLESWCEIDAFSQNPPDGFSFFTDSPYYRVIFLSKYFLSLMLGRSGFYIINAEANDNGETF